MSTEPLQSNEADFPIPSNVNCLDGGPGSPPRFWPGITSESTITLQRILAENQARFHIFFNDRQFHNHTVHTILALWALGADQSILEASFKISSSFQRPLLTPPRSINKENWKEHLGEEPYYTAYLDFFKQEIKEKGVTLVLREYVFAQGANMDVGSDIDLHKQPAMISRFMVGLFHPAIHLGYGLEFGLPGISAEGFAQAAVHRADGAKITNLYYGTDMATSTSALATQLQRAVDLHASDQSPAQRLMDAYNVLSLVSNDPRFDNVEVGVTSIFESVTDACGQAVKEYVDRWSLEGVIEKKVDELIWTNMIIYAVGGCATMEKDGHFNADFFYMHLVTSSLFLHTLVAHIDQSSHAIFLRSYFTISLLVYIGRGRPTLDIVKFYKLSDPRPVPPGPLPRPSEDAMPSSASPQAVNPNPWLGIIQTTLVHPDDHLPKLQRALVHFAEVYKDKKIGDFSAMSLRGAELLDSTIFIRAAALTAARRGWVREGMAASKTSWDRKGFYKAGHSLYQA